MSILLKPIGIQIKHRRNEIGMTMSELAKKSGLHSKTNIYQYESGRVQPPTPTMKKIAKSLDCVYEEKIIPKDEIRNMDMGIQLAIDKVHKMYVISMNKKEVDAQYEKALSDVLKELKSLTIKK